jgi:hypothetical protein
VVEDMTQHKTWTRGYGIRQVPHSGEAIVERPIHLNGPSNTFTAFDGPVDFAPVNIVFDRWAGSGWLNLDPRGYPGLSARSLVSASGLHRLAGAGFKKYAIQDPQYGLVKEWGLRINWQHV